MKRNRLSLQNFFIISAIMLLINNTGAEENPTLNLVRKFIDEFVSITPGEGPFPARFEMGNDDGEAAERPKHFVTMANSFAMARFEVPQDLYQSVIGNNPSRWKGSRNSVEMISWDDANAFCQKVTLYAKSQKLITESETIRLPSEAEWEYCCRAGTKTRYSFGDEAQNKNDTPAKASILSQYGWHSGNAAGNDPPVGALKPNPWGFYDMHGYLWEYTSDAWSPSYQRTPTDGSSFKPTLENQEIVLRSGSWKDRFDRLTSSSRRRFLRSGKDDAVGFRCVKSKSAE